MPRALTTLCLVLLPLAVLAGSRVAVPAGGRAVVRETVLQLDTRDAARELAERYLKAISHQGSEEAIDTLLGGATMTLLDMESYRFVGREVHREERGDVASLHGHVAALDRAGREDMTRAMGRGRADDDGLAIESVTADQADRLLAPTRARATAFTVDHPVFAYIARVDKQVYWNPRNPFRRLLADGGKRGGYQADLDLFWVETVDRADVEKKPRRWPLRIIRFRTDQLDTGLKVLPAASWNAE